MIIRFYGYNTFVIESGDKKVAIDPGALFFYWFRFTSLLPESEWNSITHILITHGDIDHYWHADRVAAASNAPVVCNETMLRNVDGRALMLGPRDRGLAFTTEFNKLHTLGVDETLEIDGISITAIKTTHGELVLKLGPFSTTIKPGPGQRIGWGAIGFDIGLDGKRIINLGDTLLLEKEWQSIDEPDVLMIPIGGKTVHNTMDVGQALEAVKAMHPKLVIPCHYNVPGFFTKKYNPADDAMFKREVEKSGSKCVILDVGESINLDEAL
jgi:L-ascorbate metabolism protein UlaG (beta-lactamase superfamily)